MFSISSSFSWTTLRYVSAVLMIEAAFLASRSKR